MKEETIDLKGIVTFKIFDRNGHLTRTIEENNLVTSAGKNFFVNKIIDDPSIAGSAVESIAVGSGSTVPNESNISLENETGRIQISSISSSGNVGEFVTTLSAGVATGSIQEAGLYTSDDTPVLISRIVLQSAFVKGSNESITVSWRFKIGSDSSTTQAYIETGYVQSGYV